MKKVISNEILSYIVGFLQGDGNNYRQSKNKGRLSVEISYRDKDILTHLKEIFSSMDIYVGERSRYRDTNFKKNYRSSSIHIYDQDVRKFFSQYIPVGKKAYIIKPPEKASWFIKHPYLRGLTDADGSLGISGNNRAFWSLCTSSEYIKKFVLRDIKLELGIEKRLNRNKRDGVYNIVLYDEDAVNYTNLLYGDRNCPKLDRKYKKFVEIQNWVRATPKRAGRKKAWLPSEDILIMKEDIPLKEKCTVLNRTPASIKTRIWRLKQE